MSFLLILLCVLVSIAIVRYEISRQKMCSALPPGPPSRPFLGNVHQYLFDNRPIREILTELSQKYGDIMTLWRFSTPIIVCSSPRTIRETFVDHNVELSDRQPTDTRTVTANAETRLMSTSNYSAKWKEMRIAFIQSVKSVSNCSKAQEGVVRIVEEIATNLINRNAGTPVDLEPGIIRIVYSSISFVALGKRFQLNDPQLLHLCDNHNMIEQVVNTNVKLRYPIFSVRSYINAMRWKKTLRRYMQGDGFECMGERLMRRLKEPNGKSIDGPSASNSHMCSDSEIISLLIEMTMAPVSATVAVLNWLFLQMTVNHDIQEKCYQELKMVLRGRPASINDRQHLPYNEACVMEALRFHSPAVVSVPRSLNLDITLSKYKLPIGGEAVINIWGMHHHRTLVKDPENFNPENFLDKNGKFIRPPDLYTFGAGIRSCPGDVAARNTIFLAFSTMLQHLRMERVPGYEYDLDSDRSEKYAATSPKKYFVLVRSRTE